MTEPHGIVALHGFTGRGSDFAPLQALLPGSLSWACPDLPGHGPDALEDCSPQAALRCIDCCAEEHPQHRILLGYSMGGRAALHHALSRPGRWDALILIGANPGISDPAEREKRRDEDAALAEHIELDGTDTFLAQWQEHPLIASQANIDPKWRAPMLAARKEHTARGLAQSLRQFGQGSIPDLWPKLPGIPCPTLLITGALDHKYTAIAQKMHGTLPNAVHHTLPHAGHMAHIEACQATATIVSAFLRQSH